jgi:hypothetical protein
MNRILIAAAILAGLFYAIGGVLFTALIETPQVIFRKMKRQLSATV